MNAIANLTSLFTSAVVLLIAGALLFRAFGERMELRRPPSTATKTPVSSIEAFGANLGTSSRGAETATVGVIEFSDFQCPYCGRYEREIFPALVKEYVDTGKIRYSARQFPLDSIHPLAFAAGHAATCAAEQDRFWQMHELLFSEPPRLKGDDLLKDAQTAGLNQARFQKCMESSAVKLEADRAEGRRLGVTGTPTFFLGLIGSGGEVSLRRKIVGASSLTVFEGVINGLLTARAGSE